MFHLENVQVDIMTKCSVTSVEQTKILDPPKECGIGQYMWVHALSP